MVSGISGGVRSDFSLHDVNLTPYENRPLGWTVMGPDNVTPVTSMAGWAADLYLLHDLRPRTQAELAAAAILHLTQSAGLALAVPDVIWMTRNADWDAILAAETARAEVWYELWSTVGGNRNRIARGRIPWAE